MPETVKHLLIGSIESYSGKSTAILGIAQQLIHQGLRLAYGKPLGTCFSESHADEIDEDVRFVAQTLKLSEHQLRPTLLSLQPETLLQQVAQEPTNYAQMLARYQEAEGEDLVLLEGPGSLDEGYLLGLSLLQIAEIVDGDILLIVRFHSALVLDALLSAKARLGDRLIGVLLNDIPKPQLAEVESTFKPFLEAQGIPVLGMIPRSRLLRSVSVRELVRQLNAEVLCCGDRLDLMVEQLTIGAMNVNSAMKYFRKASNMAVVTGGDRTDIQLAALETSAHCLILTGHSPPSPIVLQRAEDLEIPILLVDLDTLTTVEIVDQTFGQVRLHETIKIQCVQQLIAQHFDTQRLISQLGLKSVARL